MTEQQHDVLMEVDDKDIVRQAGNLKPPALVFGASGVQGRAVVEGLVDKGYSPVYAVSRTTGSDSYLKEVLGAIPWHADLDSSEQVSKCLLETKAKAIFVVTTTNLPNGIGMTSGFQEAQQQEYETLMQFFNTLIEVHRKDGIQRHVILSTLDNVEQLCKDVFEMTGTQMIEPLDDGSIVAHYSGKGRAGEEATKLLANVKGLQLTLLTLPFLHGNLLGFSTPLPNEGATQWTISACFGEDNKIDMLSESDLAFIVPAVLEEPEIYNGKNVRLSAEKVPMEEVAKLFSDLFGKDVIYNPLSVEEMAALPIPAAGCMAQMCAFLTNPKSLEHDVALTEAVMFPRRPQLLQDWLLVHSDSAAFEKVGLSVDGAEILSVCVFGATGMQGTSVVKGLLADARKQYQIVATTRHPQSDKAQALVALDPQRIRLVQADFDDVESCKRAVEGVDGAFLVTDFYGGAQADPAVEEQHARNVIDACEASHTVKHLVFSTMESVEEMNNILQLGLEHSTIPQFDAKARAAAYARTKKLSVTYVLMPCYSEMFLDLLKPSKRVNPETGEEHLMVEVPLNDDTKVMCMSVEDLGPAVANIFDSYQCYAGHEIGLVTDFVTVKEATDTIMDVFNEENNSQKMEATDVEMEQWLEARDTYMKDLGQIFSYMSHTDAVKKRRNVAKTMKLVPEARPLRQWVEQNKDNVAFREKLGLR